MTSSFIVPVLGTDLTAKPNKILSDYLKDNWALPSPLAAANIIFGTKWFTGYGDYQIHVRKNIAMSKPIEIPPNHESWKFIADVHIFVMASNDQEQEPVELDTIEKEVGRIVSMNKIALKNSMGIDYMIVKSVLDVGASPDDNTNFYHSLIKVEMGFIKVYIP